MHAVEVFNGICTSTGRGECSSTFDQMLNARRRIGAIAVDDVHHYQRDALKGWVMVKAETRTPEAILLALKEGAFYASSGAEFFHVERNGDFLRMECSPVHSIWLTGAGAKCEHVFGEEITCAKLLLNRFEGGFGRLSIRAKDGSRAWSNPLWLD